MPPSTTPSANTNYSLEDQFDTMQLPASTTEIIQPHQPQLHLPRSSPKDKLLNLTQQLSDQELKQAFRLEIKSLVSDYDRLITMLQQNSELLEHQNDSLKLTHDSYQRRYEKAVREMQFFKKKYEKAVELTRQQAVLGSSSSSALNNNSSPSASSISGSEGATSDALPSPLFPTSPLTADSRRTSSSSTGSSNNSYWHVHTSDVPPVPRLGKNSITSIDIPSRVVAMTDVPHAGPSVAARLSGVTQSTSPVTAHVTSPRHAGFVNSLEIQQRKVDPLSFGGSDTLWETIAKRSTCDSNAEKMISNFLRRGGSPNTAKQSSSYKAVKYGFGMIHALVVNKASASLNLVLQHGANPNAMTLSQVEEDKVTPAYLAASMGWLSGLEALVEAGADLSNAKGAGLKNKTALQVAAEHCHTPIVEYIVSLTAPIYHSQVDSMGASALHYASASGHTDLVLLIIQKCQLSVEQVDNRGEIPLHWASRHGHLEVASLLVEKCECDCNSYIPRKSVTPYDLAKAGGHDRLIEYYKNIGALTAKKMDKKKEEETEKNVPVHLESALSKNGLFGF